MPPNMDSSMVIKNQVSSKNIDDIQEINSSHYTGKNRDYEWQIVWRNVLAFVYLHGSTLYATYLMITGQVKVLTIVFGITFSMLSALGVTAGAHRLWAHRAYKAKWPLRLLLALLQTMAFQNHIYEWVRDHRVHHKFTETDADPHNARRGFFFSHIGWLMVRKHKDVFAKGASIDMSDLEQDPIVMFQKKTYLVTMPLLCFVLPSIIPVYLWGEQGWTSWYVAGIWRYTLSLNFTWLVNSAAHIYGNKPYDKYIGATDNVTVAIMAIGEGWHNYHHVFPWDYKAAELGNYKTNFSTAFIDFAAKFGWAYDLKTVSWDMIKRRVARTGDGTHPSAQKQVDDEEDHHHPENPIWGWNDKDMPEEDRECVEIRHRKNE